MIRALCRFRRNRRGNAMVEFALSAGILFPLLTSTLQLGYSLYLYNRVQTAVREGGRYAALRTYDSSTSTPSSAFTLAVQNMVAYSNPSGGTTLNVPGLTPDLVNVSVLMVNGVPDTMSVSLSTFQIDAGVAKFTVTGKPVVSYKYQGRFAPP